MGQTASFYSGMEVKLWDGLVKEEGLTYSGESELLLLFQAAISGRNNRITGGAQLGWRRGPANLWCSRMGNQAVTQT